MSKNMKTTMGPCVTLPNNATLTSNQEGQLFLNNKLSSNDQRATILYNLKSSSLISLSQLCDDNCEILLNKNNLYVIKTNDLLLKGHRNYNDRLRDIPLNNPDPLQLEIVQQPSRAGLYSNYECPNNNHYERKYHSLLLIHAHTHQYIIDMKIYFKAWIQLSTIIMIIKP